MQLFTRTRMRAQQTTKFVQLNQAECQEALFYYITNQTEILTLILRDAEYKATSNFPQKTPRPVSLERERTKIPETFRNVFTVPKKRNSGKPHRRVS